MEEQPCLQGGGGAGDRGAADVDEPLSNVLYRTATQRQRGGHHVVERVGEAGGLLEPASPDRASDPESGSDPGGDAELGPDTMPPAKLGLVSGVYLPCCQNILGIILFLRLTWITGQAGVGLTLLIIAVSALTTGLTTLSMSALATNGRIKGGGAYTVISRSLGPAVGAAVGVCFYLGTAAATSLYVLGGVEALVDISGLDFAGSFTLQLLGELLLLLLGGVVLLGTRQVARVGPAALAAVVLAVASIYIGVGTLGSGASGFDGSDGVSGSLLRENFGPSFTDGNSFGSLLALFFPSVTGIMAGSNRSSVLANPSASIPRGTLLAVGTTTTIYLSFPVLFGGAMARETLLGDKFLVPKVAWPSVTLVEVAVVMSAVGAGLQTLAGAPQLLNAIAADFSDDIPWLRRLQNKPGEEPRRALAATFVLVALLVLTGNLDVVAPFVTQFLLMCYGAVNFSCLLNAVLARPSWRPGWAFYHPLSAAAGLVLCVVLMFIDPAQAYFALAAVAVAGGIAFYTHFRGVERDWGDGLRGLRLAAAVRHVRALGDATSTHAINWRPQPLLLLPFAAGGGGGGGSGHDSSVALFNALALFRKSQSLAQAVALVEDPRAGEDGNSHRRSGAWRRERDRVEELVRHLSASARALSRTIRVPSAASAAALAVQAAGVGAVTPNLVLLEWPADWASNPGAGRFALEALRGARESDKAALVCVRSEGLPSPSEKAPGGRTIDVWWEAADGGLQILLAQTVRRQRAWRHARLRIFTAAFPLDNSLEIERRLVAHLEAARIRAEVHVVEFDADDELTPYVHMRTLEMEDRHRLLKQMQLVRTTPQGFTVYARPDDEPAPAPLSELERQRTLGHLRKDSTLRDAGANLGGGDGDGDGDGDGEHRRAASDSLRERANRTASPPSAAARGHARGAAQHKSTLEALFEPEEAGGAGGEQKSGGDEAEVELEVSGGGGGGGGGGDAGDGAGGNSGRETEMGGLEEDEDGGDGGDATPAAPERGVAFSKHNREYSAVSLPSMGREASLSERVDGSRGQDSAEARKRRMMTALLYNKHLREASAASDLVITNLPSLHLYPSEHEFFEFVDVLCEGLGPVMLARGSRSEVITTYV